jgi:hypothetical protein
MYKMKKDKVIEYETTQVLRRKVKAEEVKAVNGIEKHDRRRQPAKQNKWLLIIFIPKLHHH